MRPRVVLLLAGCLLLCLLGGSGMVAASPSAQAAGPSTNGTVGYVDGYWYNDTLPVDDRTDPVVSEDELDAVIARTMARVEVIRNETFESAVPVDVMPRDEFQETGTELFLNATDEELRRDRILFEAMLMLERDSDIREEYDALYGGAVSGYYDPETDQIVVIAEDTDEPELDEITLGHELVHALQDQRFGLDTLNRSTIDRGLAINGLVEGESVVIDRTYRARCRGGWSCLPVAGTAPGGSYNPGMFLILYQPYNDGPGFVRHLRDGGGWSAVDEAFDVPPASTSEVIRPGTVREPESIAIDDRSNDEWEPIVVDNRTSQRVGEAGMAAMAMYRSLAGTGEVLPEGAVAGSNSQYDYDHDVTRGWAGDAFVAYSAGPDADETGFVWRSEWVNESSAELFAAAYVVMLKGLGAESVDDRSDTYTLDGAYPGAYYVERNETSVTLVRAPSVDQLGAVHEGAAPAGPDRTDTDSLRDRLDGEAEDPGFPVSLPIAVVGLGVLLGLLVVGLGRRNH